MMKTIAVIGGGAAGLMASYAAARKGNIRILLFERQSRVGRKLLATGNGRCNLSNANAGASHYHGEDPDFVHPALELLSVENTRAVFREMGLLTALPDGDGRIYPLSDSANSVLDVLRFALDRLPVELHPGEPVTAVHRQNSGFLLETDEASYAADAVIIACGGCAGGKLGGVSDGYMLLQALGHSRTALHPALTQITSDSPYPRTLKGVRVQARIRMERNGREIGTNRGEIQFTEKGISGIAVFEVSRLVSVGGGCRMQLDFLPDISEEELVSLLRTQAERRTGLPGEELLTGILHNKLGRTLCRAAGIAGTACEALTGEDILRCAAMCKRFALNAVGTGGFDTAQVTAGGIRTSEFDPNTLESRFTPGVYACGEVLDIDGDCGGYNLQWAWSSGYLAGTSAFEKCEGQSGGFRHGARE